MFKVVPDQLRISDGWVRCGKCEEIFDAAAHMQEAAVPAPGDEAAAQAASFEGTLATAMASDAPPAPRRPAASSKGSGRRASARTPREPELAPAEADTVIEPVVHDTSLPPEGAGPGDRTEPVFTPEAAPTTGPAAAAAELSFMRDAARASRWHRPLVRATLMVIGLLLALGLALQVLVHERDRIAVLQPDLRPLIEDVCLLLECEIEPLRQIESVVIDSSAFSKIKGDLYRLSLTLKNNAPIDLAMPAVELALTDTLDRPLMRRVFQPEELGAKTGVIPAASETQSTLVLTIRTNGSGERIAGYRLLAFYP